MSTMENKLVVCETTAAIVLHLRWVGDGEINYSGRDAYAMTLCDAVVGWDTKDDLVHATCRDCLTIMSNRKNGISGTEYRAGR